MFVPTQEQISIIEAPLEPHCIIACPGSGKTATAVRRVLEVRRRLEKNRGYVALFSYSNVAVDTFRKEYLNLSASYPGLSSRVVIETFDAFIATHLIRPHGASVMGCPKQPFLVSGSELFLKGKTFQVWDESPRPHSITDLQIEYFNGEPHFFIRLNFGHSIPIRADAALKAIRALAKVGGYTHELARYWAIQVIQKYKGLEKILARRFPHVVVDEAQDIGPMQGLLLNVLAQGGCCVSLVGDPNQGIFEFAGADGSYLRDYKKRGNVKELPLSQNRRSVSSIIDIANRLSASASTPFRDGPERKHGAFYISYDESKPQEISSIFKSILAANAYFLKDAAILCRSNSVFDSFTGAGDAMGKGATGYFARAAVLRDKFGDIAKAFEAAVSAVLRLIDTPGERIRYELLHDLHSDELKLIHRLVWNFLRSSTSGIPDARLAGKSKWQPALKQKVQILLTEIETNTPWVRSPTWGNNLTTAGLSNTPLWNDNFGNADEIPLRVDTVHKAKGEGISAVLYAAKTSDVNKMLDGTDTEDGKIGYVAITRARDLFLLGVPTTANKKVIARIEAAGIIKWVQ